MRDLMRVPEPAAPDYYTQSPTGSAIPVWLAAEAYRKPTEKPVQPKNIDDHV